MVSPGSAQAPASRADSESAAGDRLARMQDSTDGEGTFLPGEVLADRFRIHRFIAQGGAGEVYEAEDLELRVPVALKVVRPEIADNEHAIERFRREIQLARQVTHANVCRIFDVFRHEIPDSREGRPPRRFLFLTMELLRGESLASKIHREGPLSTEQALPIVRDMAAGLGAAHRAGVVHRDFKSANVVLVPQNGTVRSVITDFGLARGEVSTESFPATITHSGTVVGTPTYMAPEQLTGAEITAAVDVYALGIVMYEMVTGKRPFKGETDLSTAVKRLTEAPASPRVHLPDLDPRWEKAILGCLEREPENRLTLEQLLGRLEERPAAKPEPAAPTSGTATPAQRPPATAAAGTAARRPTTGPAPHAPPRPPVQRRAAAKRPPSRWRLVALVALLAAAVASGFFLSSLMVQERAAPELDLGLDTGRSRSIAVLEFKNLSGQESDAWLSSALQEMVNMELAAGGALQPLPSESIDRVAQELEVSGASGLADDTVERLAEELGASMVIDGSYLLSGGQIRLHLRLHTEDSTVLLTVPGEAAKLFEMVTRAGNELRTRLGLDEYLGAPESPGEKPEAMALYEEARDEMRRLNAPRAMELFTQVIEQEPIHAEAHVGLASSYEFLGYEQDAKRTARRALDLAAPLSREKRLLIEATESTIRGDSARSSELFSSLYRFFPENLDYGLGLVRAQIENGQGSEALETLAEVRPLATAGDHRLDLLEARAAGVAGDYQRQIEAARRAATADDAQTDRLLVAEARLLEARGLMNSGSLRAARQAAGAAHATFTETDVTRGAAESLRLLGVIAEEQGDTAAGQRMRQEADRLEAQLEQHETASFFEQLPKAELPAAG